MRSIEDVLNNKISGLYYGNRVILPFIVNPLKIVIESDIITDFSISSKGAYISERESFMDIYFLEYKNLKDSIKKYECIKMIAVEKGKDIFDFNNHKKIALRLDKGHRLIIEKLDEDIAFIE